MPIPSSTPERPRSRPATSRAAWIAAGLVWLAGVVARTWYLRLQLFSGDETHAVHSALLWPLSKILVTYRLADHCIPLASFYRMLVDAGVELSEGVIRAPAVLAGVAMTAILPLLVYRWASRSGPAGAPDGAPGIAGRWAALYCALLVVSPSLLYYSRIARPYALIALLAPLAVAGFWRWWNGGGTRWSVLFVLAGGFSAWLHLGTAPFLGAPFLYAVADLLLSRRAGGAGGRERSAPGPVPGWGGLIATAAGLAAAVAAFLVPALPSFLRLLRDKADHEVAGGAGFVWDVARLQAGSARHLVAALFWLAVALSFVLALRRARRAAVYGASLVACQWLGIVAILQPQGYHLPIVLNRYVLVTLPLVLLLLAYGLAHAWARLAGSKPAGRWAAAAAPWLAVVGLAAAGPYAADPALRFGPFAGHPSSIAFFEPPAGIPVAALPGVYSLIGREPGDGAVIELTGGTAGYQQRTALAIWRAHHRPMITAVDTRMVRQPGLGLRTVVPFDPARMEASAGRFVVLHRDLPRLGRLNRYGPGSDAAARATPRRHPAVVKARQAGRKLVAAWGAPDLVDGSEWVWDLARVRRAGGAQPPSPGDRRGATKRTAPGSTS